MSGAVAIKLMGLITKAPQSKPISLEQTIRVLNGLGAFVATKRNIELAYLFGVAFDTVQAVYDRKRFRQSFKHILKNGKRDDALLICFDPNFYVTANYVHLLRQLPESVGLNPDNLFLESSFEDIPLFRLAFPEKMMYVVFINYALQSAYIDPTRLAIGQKVENQINIMLDEKTISTYVRNCRYTAESFYGKLEALALTPNVQKLYIASSASAHTISKITKGSNIYQATNVRKEFGMNTGFQHWYIQNRYLEDFCEIIALMENVSRVKPVAFINLDRAFPTFEREGLLIAPQPAGTFPNIPYEVPFNARTRFVKPKFTRVREGGKRKRRATLRKRRV